MRPTAASGRIFYRVASSEAAIAGPTDPGAVSYAFCTLSRYGRPIAQRWSGFQFIDAGSRIKVIGPLRGNPCIKMRSGFGANALRVKSTLNDGGHDESQI